MNERWKQSFIKYQEREYKNIWDTMIKQLTFSESNNCVWLQGPANYLFKTRHMCWGMDLAFRNPVIFNQLKGRIREDLRCLKFVLLTHEHRDHMDMELIGHISELPILWILPDFLNKETFYDAGLPKNRVIWINAGETVIVEGIEIKAFNGMHWDDGGTIGKQSLGYFINTGERRILFPGDVRDYDPQKLPFFDEVDSLFAHVWLGRENALNFPWDKYQHLFCKFMLSANSKKIFLTHLYEVARPLTDLWTYSHCGPIMDEILSLNMEVRLEIPTIGRPYLL